MKLSFECKNINETSHCDSHEMLDAFATRSKDLKDSLSSSFGLQRYCIKTKGNVCIFYGYASVFGVRDLQKDIIMPGSFSSIDPRTVKLLWQHDPKEEIGRILKLKEDGYGLYIKAIIYEDRTCLLSNIVNEDHALYLSIGYYPTKYFYDEKRRARIITDIRLFEVSVVNRAANKYAKIIDITENCSPHELLAKSLNDAINVLINL